MFNNFFLFSQFLFYFCNTYVAKYELKTNYI